MIRAATAPPLGTPFVVNRRSPQAVGLVGWWPVIGAPAGPLLDRSGYGRVGSLTASPSTVPNPDFGVGLDLNGTTQYATLGTEVGYFLKTSPFSVSAWIRPDSVSGTRIVMANWAYLSVAGWQADISGGKVSLGIFNSAASGYRYAGGTTTLVAGAVYHVAYVYTGNNAASGIQTYINGRPETMSVANNSDPGVLGNAPTYLGRRNALGGGAGLDGYFDGLMGDSRLYNRALSAAEVFALWNPATRWGLYGVRAPRGRGAAFFATMMQHHHAMLAGGRR